MSDERQRGAGEESEGFFDLRGQVWIRLEKPAGYRGFCGRSWTVPAAQGRDTTS